MLAIDFEIAKIRACIQIAACVCGRDGVISQVEERAIFTTVTEHFPEFPVEEIDKALSDFFDSNQQIEDYLLLIEDEGYRQFALYLAETSASADGLNIKENIALERAYIIWEMMRNA